MKVKSTTQTRKPLILTGIVLLVLALAFLACALYLNDYYRADTDAIEAYEPTVCIEPQALPDGSIVLKPEDARIGFIFYPGGKVEHEAYLPLMQACAAEGILCVLVEMPFRLAVFDINAADGIRERYPDIEAWYIGGHSLGGSMAAGYLVGHADEYEGLILLGSYSAADLSDTELSVLSVYGSEDRVMNREKYEASKGNLPENLAETVLEGGCHAYFGMYGEQDGDGTPTITSEEQINLTAQTIAKFIDSSAKQ